MVDSRPVFLAHIPRSGGTTVTSWIASKLPADAVFPSGSPHDLISQKMFPWALPELSSAARQRIRFYAPHLPLSTHELLGIDLRLAALVRDPIDQLQSVLDLQPAAPDATDVVAQLQHVTMPWYLTHQLCWYLGADAADVLTAYERASDHDAADLGRPLDDAMVAVVGGRDLVDRACARLDRIELLARATDADRLARTIARCLGLPEPPVGLHLNSRPERHWPEGATAAARPLLEADLQVYSHALQLLGRSEE